MPNWCTTPWIKQLEQWLRWTKNKHKDIKLHAMLFNNCLCYWVLTILLRQTCFYTSFGIFEFFGHTAKFIVVCKWHIETCGALVHISLTVQNCGTVADRLDPAMSVRKEKERERGPPASCPGFVYNKKPLFDVVAQPAPKLLLPQDVLWVKCQTEATAGWLQPHHTSTLSKGLWRLRETYKTTTVWCIFVLCLGEKCVRIICLCLSVEYRCLDFPSKASTILYCRSLTIWVFFIFLI